MNDRRADARRALEHVCARGDLEAARQLDAVDFVDHVNRLGFRGHEGIAESVALYRAGFPDLAIRVEEQVAQGERVVSHWTLEGTTSRAARDPPPASPSPGFRNGTIAEDRTVSDNAALLQQLGRRRAIALARAG